MFLKLGIDLGVYLFRFNNLFYQNPATFPWLFLLRLYKDLSLIASCKYFQPPVFAQQDMDRQKWGFRLLPKVLQYVDTLKSA